MRSCLDRSIYRTCSCGIDVKLKYFCKSNLLYKKYTACKQEYTKPKKEQKKENHIALRKQEMPYYYINRVTSNEVSGTLFI